MRELAERALRGDRRAIARLISLAESGSESLKEAMEIIHPRAGRAHVIGVTGVMGVGKSTLICEMALKYREMGKSVGIVAVDPTSPFTGGALLGDRVRMNPLASDGEVFIRSMGTRGKLGGLSGAVYDAVEILDASGKDIIIVETVGVGQAEVDVIRIADTTVVVLVPGLGDFIQTIKAGLMEIADIFVVNKSDRPGADSTVNELKSMMEISEKMVPVVCTSATEGEGVDELLVEVENHFQMLKDTGELERRRRRRYETELVEIVMGRLKRMIYDEGRLRESVGELVRRITDGELDPHSAAEEVLAGLLS